MVESSILKTDQFELQVIGSGAGASSIYDGLTSSSFMLLCNGSPFCLIDLGLGVGREVIKAFGRFPSNIIITHNHSDHAGDLPVVLRVELARNHRCRVFGHAEVVQRLKQHRVAEHIQQLSADELADWQPALTGQPLALAHELTIEFYPGVHSEASYGFVIRNSQQHPLLSYTGDSQLEADLYQAIVEADVFILDARPQANPWHASFDEVKPWLKPGGYILGHGLTDQQAKIDYVSWPLLLSSQRISF